MEKKLLFHNAEVVASFPYEFDMYEEENGNYGYVLAHLYSDLKIEEADREEVSRKLMDIPCIENCHFMLEGNDIVYRTFRKLESVEDTRACEVLTRRSFIEDYIEAAEDLDIIASEHEGKFLKTEFVY